MQDLTSDKTTEDVYDKLALLVDGWTKRSAHLENWKRSALVNVPSEIGEKNQGRSVESQ